VPAMNGAHGAPYAIVSTIGRAAPAANGARGAPYAGVSTIGRAVPAMNRAPDTAVDIDI
jgi:hypothetical protein